MQPVVFKFSLPTSDDIELEMPPVIQLLHYDVQYDVPTLWALVDGTPGAPKSTRRFYLRGTGHPLPTDEPVYHVGSAVTHGGRLVTHLFAARVP